MKIRDGSVTNRSSSRFIMLGTQNERVIDAIAEATAKGRQTEAEKYSEWPNYRRDWGNIMQSYGLIAIFIDEEAEKPDIIGVYPIFMLQTMTIPQAAEKLAELIKNEFGIDVPTAGIHLHSVEEWW